MINFGKTQLISIGLLARMNRVQKLKEYKLNFVLMKKSTEVEGIRNDEQNCWKRW